jgi:hypothetical protein
MIDQGENTWLWLWLYLPEYCRAVAVSIPAEIYRR